MAGTPALGAAGLAEPAAPPAPAALAQEIARLMQGFSVETTPPELARLRSLPAELTRASRVYITWIPSSRFEHMLRAAVHLRELGMTPVPHLAVRAIADAAALETMLAQLRREAAVDDVLLVAGSQRVPSGSLDNTPHALASGAFERQGLRCLALAAHPEGSPDIGADALVQALRDKNAHARQSPLQMRLVTQFCFAAAPIVDWERAARADGNRLPMHVGLAGLASLPTLVRYARSCGVGASLGTLTRQAGRLFKLTSALPPGEIVVALARARLADPACLVERCHFFPFGSLAATVAWAARVAAGDFVLRHDDGDLSVSSAA